MGGKAHLRREPCDGQEAWVVVAESQDEAKEKVWPGKEKDKGKDKDGGAIEE